jgi:EcsC family protein
MAEEQSDRLLKAVQTVAISPADAKAVVQRLRAQSEKENPKDEDGAHRDRIAAHIISRYAKLAATSGGVTALSGVIPGIGTAIAMVGGGMADAVVGMKLQVDMVMCLAEAFGHDLLEPDAMHLCFLIAAGSSLEKAGVETGVKLASKAGVNMLRQYLKGTALQAVKELFKKVGLAFARNAAEKALPFGIGVVLGASGDYALTRFVGTQAKKWFVLDRETRSPE